MVSSQSYCLRKITEFLDSEEIQYKLTSQSKDEVSTGCYIKFPDSTIEMSIQTDQNITKMNFAQTVISINFKYYSVIDHPELEDFIYHFKSCRTSLINTEHQNTSEDTPSVDDLLTLLEILEYFE